MIFVNTGEKGSSPNILGKDLNQLLAEVPASVEAITGVNLIDSLRSFGNVANAAVLNSAVEGAAEGFTSKIVETALNRNA